MIKQVTYNEILELRRKLGNINGVSPVLYQEATGAEYVLSMNDGGIVTEAVVEAGDIADFEANRKPYCNKIQIPNILEKVTHNFASNTSWIYGTNNSLYAIVPDNGKLLRIKRFMIKFDKDTTLANDIRVAVWQTVDGTVCPAFTEVVTPFDEAPYFDPPTTLTGWYKHYPASGDPQEVEVWLWMDSGVAKYKVSSFTYPTIEDIRIKATTDTVVGNVCMAEYNYKMFNISMTLCSSFNERIELWVDTHTALTSPNSIKCVCSVMSDSLDEW